MKALSRFLFGTLRGRLIVGVALVHAVMMALFITDLTARQRAMLLDRQVEEATALSQALATSAAGWIAANDIAGLQELVEAQRRYPEILFAILADQEGRVLADTDTSRQELYMLDLPGEARQTVLDRTPALVDVVAPAMIGGHQVGWARVGIGQKAAGEKLAAIIRDGVAYALAAILLGSLIAWFMGRRITRRLYAVQETIAAVRSGNRLARSSLVGTDEAAVIAQDFNQMLDVIVERDAELREKTEELDHYFTEALDLLCIADTDGYFRRLNPAWEATLGFPVSELEGRRFLDFIHPEDLEATRQVVSMLADQKEVSNFVNRYRHSNGEYRWIEWRAIPTGRRIYAVARDITEHKLADEALRKSEEFNRNILATVDEGFIVVGRDYRILSANRAFCNMMNLSEDRVTGRPCHEVAHRTDRPCFESGEDCAVRRTFETGAPHSATHTHEDASGAKQYVELKSFPVFDASGKVVSAIETINDVTEKRKLEEQLQQARKMEAVGTLAGGVAHDFNNMLMVIIGHAELALQQMAPDQPFSANLREIRKAAGRSADLTRQLLTFARKQTVTPKVLDLNVSVKGMLKMLRRLIGEDIDLAWLPGKVVWPVKVDPSQIDQILANLCVNARDAIAGVGKITIETRNATIDEAYCSGHPEAVPGEYLLLAVSDDGCGMDKQTLDKIFEPFFTTKEKGKGTGLGLATVYGIAKQNNGFINVYSEPGKGSTFKIYLPRHTGRAVETPEESPATPVIGGHETILLAEDETAILDMVKQILEDFGYRILTASTPGQAIRMAKEYAGDIDLLITDVVMPEMNGLELAKSLLALHPKLRIIYMSGYSGNVIARHGVLDEGVNFIQKPFSMQDFAAKVREVLDSK